jgi:phosphohistidine phosphatase
MKKLILMRHARAERHGEDGRDENRALHPKGAAIVKKVGAYLQAEGHRPQLVMHSSAKRTTQTAWGLCECFNPSPMSEGLDALYLATAPDIINIVGRTEPTVETLVIVGHNPGIGDLTMALLADQQTNDISRSDIQAFPPAAFAIFELDIDNWHAARTARLVDYHIAETLT